MHKLKVNDLCKIKAYTTVEQMHSAALTTPGTAPGWAKLIFPLDCGIVRVVLNVSKDAIEISDPGKQYGYRLDPGWVEAVAQTRKVQTSQCRCTLSRGCMCGGMIEEMAARDLIKDPWSGLWIKKAK